MAINIRAKGQNGEREVQQALEAIVREAMLNLGYPLPEKPIIQRNQNQSAVGGSDLVGTFGMCIEIKRQETLSVNSWWKQCIEAADYAGEHPVLLYRQNGKKWRCVTLGWLPVTSHSYYQARVEIDWETFLAWFKNWVIMKLSKG
jgi:hypothetical protein